MKDLSKREIESGLKNDIAYGAANSAKIGFINNYLIPFSLFLGANKLEVGLLKSIPGLFSILVQPIAGEVVHRFGRRKTITKTFYALSKIFWIPVILLPFFFQNQILWLISFVTIISILNSATSIAWLSWISDLIPEKIRGYYFGERNMIGSAATLISVLLAGWILGKVDSAFGFAIVFSLGVLMSVVAYYFLSKMPETRYKIQQHKIHRISLGISDFLHSLKRYKNFSNFTWMIAFINFSVWIASPFFVVYMFENLKIDYWWYGVIISASALSNMFFNRYWGKMSDRFGDRPVLSICTILISFYPLFFLFVRNPYDLLLIEIFSGFAWSGFDLTAFNFAIDSSPKERRPIYIANFRMFSGIPMIIAPFLGGLLAEYLSQKSFFLLYGIQILFLLSFILRIVSAAIFIPKLKEERIKLSKSISIRDLFFRSVSIYPAKSVFHDLSYTYNYLAYLERKLLKKTKAGYRAFIDLTEIKR